jgi:hypothetical protein
VVGQAGERVGRRLAVEPGAILGVRHRSRDEVGVLPQALLGAGRELVGIVGHHDERAPQRGAAAHRRGQARAAVLALEPAARDGIAAAQAVQQAARWHLDDAVGRVGRVLVVRPAPEDRDVFGVLIADDGGAVGAQQAPGIQRDEREDARGRGAGGDGRRHAP